MRSHSTSMFLLLVAILFGGEVVMSSTTCPENCTCTKERPFVHPSAFNREDTVMVVCPPDPTWPDLTPLKNDISEKILVIKGRTRDTLISLNKTSFPRGMKITELLFRSLDILSISNDAFENLQPTLLRLDLSWTRLDTQGPLIMLSGLIHLEILDLHYNFFFWNRKRERADFDSMFKNLGLEKLRVLKMGECHIYNMTDAALEGLENLEELDLSDNKMVFIPPNLGRLRKLKVLDVSENNIKTLRGALFQNNKLLQRLHLASNPNLEIKYDAFIGLENSLVDLDIQNTGQKAVPTVALSRLKALKYLNMSENPITEMDTDSLQGEYCLQELNLRKVYVQLQPTVFNRQTSCISVITVSGTGTYIPTTALQSLSKLEYLKYSDNSHMKILERGSFGGIKAKTIVLKDLKINTIEKGAFDGVHIPLSLYLEKVDISSISFALDYPKGTFKVLSIEDSPSLKCGCSLASAMHHLECALTGSCEGDRYNYLDDPGLRRHLSTVCPNGPDLTKIYLKCYETDSSQKKTPEKSITMVLASVVILLTRS